MDRNTFRTLAAKFPFPKSDIDADYGPVEKQVVGGDILQVIAALVAQGPIEGSLLRATNDGALVVSGANNSPVLVIPSRHDVASFTTDPITRDIGTYVSWAGFVTALVGATPAIHFFIDVLLNGADWYQLFDVGVVNTHEEFSVDPTHGQIYTQNVFGGTFTPVPATYRVRGVFAAGTTSADWYLCEIVS